jgi:hypothetical protein
VKSLRASIRVHNPDIIFLSKTKTSGQRINRVASLLGFPNFVCVEALGKLGGICLFWPHHVHVKVLEFDSQMIVISIHSNLSEWNLVGFYGPPHQSKRRIAWENLHALLESLDGPWVCLGDFNTILEDSGKEGGNAANFLRELLFNLGAVNLGYTGNKFTWCNKRLGKCCIRERLDRGIANGVFYFLKLFSITWVLSIRITPPYFWIPIPMIPSPLDLSDSKRLGLRILVVLK